jgi:hypothetical protein
VNITDRIQKDNYGEKGFLADKKLFYFFNYLIMLVFTINENDFIVIIFNNF